MSHTPFARPLRPRTVAVALAVATLAALSAGEAAAARTVIAVPGDVGALTFSGGDLVAASQPTGRGLSVLRLRAGAPAQVLLADRTVDRDELVSLAGSTRALAVGLASASFTHSRVLAGPAGGPLREVAACAKTGLPGPVAAFGSRIAWGEAGCSGAAPALAIGDADAAATPRRVPLPGVPATIALAADGSGLVGLLRDANLNEVRPFGAGAIGAPIATSPYVAAALGILGDGTRAVLVRGEGSGCEPTHVFTLAAGSGERRDLDFGACVAANAIGGTGDVPRVTADRVVALTVKVPRDTRRDETFSVVSVRADGSDRREIARGDDTRAPGSLAADGDRVAWAQPACYRGSEVVIDSIASPATYRVRHCRGEILTRSARVRDGRITVRVRCPLGCNGSVDVAGRVGSTRFAFPAGTGSVRVKVALGTRRSARLRVRLHVNNSVGVADSATISVRR